MEGISRRELARRHNISESTVRRHVDSGALGDAFLRDGSLHPRKAAEVLRRVLSEGKVIPRDLVDARERRTRAQVLRLFDEVNARRANSISPAAALIALEEQFEVVRRSLRRMPKAAMALAGRPAAEVIPKLRQIVFDATESAGTEEAEEAWWDMPPMVEAPPFPDLAALPSNGVLAQKIGLQAEKIEFAHALEHGGLRDVDDVAAEFEDKLGVLKSALFALPGRVAHGFEAATPEEVRALVAAEVEEAISAL